MKIPEDLSSIEELVQAIQKKPEYQNIRNEIEEQIIEKFDNTIDKVDFESQTVISNIAEGPKLKAVHAKRQQDNSLGFDIEQITEQVESLENVVKDILSQSQISKEKEEELKRKNQEIQKIYKDIYHNTYKQIIKMGYKTKSTPNISFKNVSDLRNKMNEIINEYAQYPAISLQEGTL